MAYLDASALVKRCVAERGSRETGERCATADVVATSVVSRAEVAAALAKAVRLGLVEPEKGRTAQRAFASQWPDFAKVPVTEALVSRAEALAWDFALRGYDAVQLASALTWQELVGAEITLSRGEKIFDARIAAGGKGLFEGVAHIVDPINGRQRKFWAALKKLLEDAGAKVEVK